MKKTLMIEGMSCQHCVMAVKKALSSLDGVKSVEVDLDGNKAVVEVDNGLEEQLKTVVEDAGYDVTEIK